nr:peptidase C1 [candidate division Zixibacteria bacterium]
MKSPAAFIILLAALILVIHPAAGQNDHVKYVPKYEDPVLKEIGEQADKEQAARDSLTADIREKQAERNKADKALAMSLRFDMSQIPRPNSPDEFKSLFHFPPVAQYRTGTCWCFSGISFVESEIYRVTGEKIKLSEMYIVYYEFLDKVRHFIRERGDFAVYDGSMSNAVFRVMEKYGAVPIDAYSGLITGERYDHERMSQEIRDYLAFIKNGGYWDEDLAVQSVTLILDKYMGRPPEYFEFEGATFTPREFFKKILQVKPEDYIDAMSTLRVPFYSIGEFKVWDNWWHDSSYYNLPLDEWYGLMKKAIGEGYTVALGGDISEPGYYGFEDIAVVPDFDIPGKYINQDSREFRTDNESTGDDHGIHVIGFRNIKGRDWFLIKDSARSGRRGKFEGYFFYRDDYIKLKMLTFMVHKDALGDILTKFSQLK